MKGFSTIEIMIALLILTSTVTSAVAVALQMPIAEAQSQEKLIATRLASEQLQKEFLLGLTSFSSVDSSATTSLSVGNIAYSISLTDDLQPDGVTKHITSTVSWLAANDIQTSISLYGIVTDFNHASLKSCPDLASGNWSKPRVTTLTMPGPIQSLGIVGNELVAGVLSATTKTASKFFTFSLLAPFASSTSPVLLSSLSIATSTKYGPASLASDGTLAYLANAAPADFDICTSGPSCSQIQILDGLSSSTPYVRSFLKLATTTPPYATGSGGQSAGKSITFSHGLLYVGLQKTSGTQGDEFNIIDVHNPDAPMWIGGYHIGRTVNHIEIQGDYAYLATDDPTKELTILDVHDPANITLAGSYDAPGSINYGYGESVALASTTLLLGRSYISGEPQLTELSVASPALPIVMSTGPTTTAATTSSIQDSLFEGSLGFILTTSAIEVWNTTTTGALSLIGSTPLPHASTASNAGLACNDKYLYVASVDASHTGYLTILTGS